jgi:hypothetical protein
MTLFVKNLTLYHNIISIRFPPIHDLRYLRGMVTIPTIQINYFINFNNNENNYTESKTLRSDE